MQYEICAKSVNGDTEYTHTVHADSEAKARTAFIGLVADEVQRNYGVSPAGIAWLADTRTMTVEVKGQ